MGYLNMPPSTETIPVTIKFDLGHYDGTVKDEKSVRESIYVKEAVKAAAKDPKSKLSKAIASWTTGKEQLELYIEYEIL